MFCLYFIFVWSIDVERGRCVCGGVGGGRGGGRHWDQQIQMLTPKLLFLPPGHFQHSVEAAPLPGVPTALPVERTAEREHQEWAVLQWGVWSQGEKESDLKVSRWEMRECDLKVRGSVISRWEGVWSQGERECDLEVRGSVVSRCEGVWSWGERECDLEVRGSVISRWEGVWSQGERECGLKMRGSVIPG